MSINYNRKKEKKKWQYLPPYYIIIYMYIYNKSQLNWYRLIGPLHSKSPL